MQLRDTGSGDFEQPEPGSYAAVCYKSIDIGTQTSEYNGETKKQHKIVIAWELDEKMADGRPFTIAQFYTASLHEKAKLRAHLEAWRGRQFTSEELEGFDSKNLLGKACMLSLIKNEKGKIRLQSVSKLPKGMQPPVQINPSVYFNLQEFNQGIFESLTNGIKKLILQSPEYHAIQGGAAPVPGVVADDEVPF